MKLPSGWERFLPPSLSPSEAISLQKRLKDHLILDREVEEADLIAGVDTASPSSFFSPPEKGGESITVGAIVVWSLKRKEVIASAVSSGSPTMPYIPGLLAFRELPVIIKAFQELSITPQVVLVDGQGTAHPRQFGIACHLGLILNIPTIGCGKTRLWGVYEEPGGDRESWSPLYPPHSGSDLKTYPASQSTSPIGAVVRTRTGTKPLYISPGHLCNLNSAIRIVLTASPRYRLPEPIRLAHQLAGNEFKAKRKG